MSPNNVAFLFCWGILAIAAVVFVGYFKPITTSIKKFFRRWWFPK